MYEKLFLNEKKWAEIIVFFKRRTTFLTIKLHRFYIFRKLTFGIALFVNSSWYPLDIRYNKNNNRVCIIALASDYFARSDDVRKIISQREQMGTNYRFFQTTGNLGHTIIIIMIPVVFCSTALTCNAKLFSARAFPRTRVHSPRILFLSWFPSFCAIQLFRDSPVCITWKIDGEATNQQL